MNTAEIPVRIEPIWSRQLRFRNKTALGPCLLISRETGAGGSEIAQRLAERLGWDLLDKEILALLAVRYGTPREFLHAVDEKRVGWLTDILYGWLEGHGFSQLAYVHRLHLLFNAIAKKGSVVIVGRGARFILPRRAGFSVRIIAPFNYRVQQVVVTQGLSLSGARHYVEHADREQHSFLKKYFHRNASDPHVHDLVVNVERLGQEQALSLITDALNFWLQNFEHQSTIK